MAYEDNEEFYRNSITQYGISAQGVHWNSTFSQNKRFEIITKLIRKKILTSSLVDVGCGFADYYTYLEENNYDIKEYIGIDCEKNMIDICKTKYKNIDFLLLNVLEDTLPKKDYYICSGALNILNKKEVNLFIKNCFEASNKAFIFNFLSTDSFNNVDKNILLTYCESLSTDISVKSKYLYNDTTIILRK